MCVVRSYLKLQSCFCASWFHRLALEIDELCRILDTQFYQNSTKIFTDFTEFSSYMDMSWIFHGSAVQWGFTIHIFFRNRATPGFAVLPKSRRSVPLWQPGSTGPVDWWSLPYLDLIFCIILRPLECNVPDRSTLKLSWQYFSTVQWIKELKTKHNRKYPIDGDFLLFWIFAPIMYKFAISKENMLIQLIFFELMVSKLAQKFKKKK